MWSIQEQLGFSRFITIQVYYSLLERDLESEIVPFVEDAKRDVLV